MAHIEVRHNELRDVARAIHDYCNAQDRHMNALVSDVRNTIARDWEGADAAEFIRQWGGVNARGSMAVNFRDSLRNYAEALVACANDYQQTQANVVNSAGILMNLVSRLA